MYTITLKEALERFDEKFVENTDNMGIIRIIRQQQAGSTENLLLELNLKD